METKDRLPPEQPNAANKPKTKLQGSKEKKKDDVDYKKETKIRPTYSFAAMITMAIRSSSTGKLILREIYEYISKNFPFYKMSSRGWQNSVRHNLSMHKCFQKIPREGSREHKGNYWGINELGEDVFQDGDYKRRRKMKHHSRLSAPIGMYGTVEDPDAYARYTPRVQRNLTVPYTNGVFGSSQHMDPCSSQCHQMASIPAYNHLSTYTSQSQFTSHAILPMSHSNGTLPPQIAPPPPPPANSFSIHPYMNQAQQNQAIDVQPAALQYQHSNVYCYPCWPDK